MSRYSDQTVDELGLGDECREALKASGVHTIEHLSALTEKELLQLPLFKKSWLVSVERCLRVFDYVQMKSARQFEAESIVSDSAIDETVLSRSIDSLHLTIRAENCLKSAGIYLIGNLVSKKEGDLLRIPNLGKTSIILIRDNLAALGLSLGVAVESWSATSLQDENRSSPDFLMESDVSRSLSTKETSTHRVNEVSEEDLRMPLRSIIEQFQEGLSEQQLVVFQVRFGYSGEVGTLQDVGRKLGVTRERIRQIQVRIERKLKDRIEEEMVSALDALLAVDRKQPLYQMFLGVEDSWFEGWEALQNSLSLLISKFSRRRFYSCNSDLGSIIARVPDGLKTALDGGKKIFETSASRQETLFYVKLRIDALCLELSAPELSSLVFDTLRPLAYVVNEEALGMEARIVAFGKSAKAAALGVLYQNNRPMHFSEVAEQMSDILGKKVRPNYAQNTLVDAGALLIGRGLYGFREHIKISDDIEAEICDTAEEIIKSGEVGKQWHCHELINCIEKERPDLPEIPNGYVLNAFLHSSDDLTFFRRQVWGLKKDAGSFEKRVDLSEAIESILEEAGQPLTKRQIKSELSKWRGTSSVFLINPNERVVRVAPQTFGLLDRDVPLSLSDQDIVLAAIVAYLTELGRGLSQEDVSNFLSKNGFNIADPYLILTIAPREPRLNIYNGSVLGLSDWGESRYVSTRKAVEKAIGDLGDKAAIDRLLERASEIRGSKISRQEFYESLADD